MKVLKPFYYDKFSCIGSQCKDSCCMGWTIYIDKKSYIKYKKVKGEFGKVLNDVISRNRKNETYLHYGDMELNNARCKLLNDKNLCDLYINLGEDYLCNTCKQYPRLIYKNGDICEKTLNLSCPEVARIFVESNEIFSFNMENEMLSEADKQYILENKYDKRLYDLLWEGRSLSIEVAQFREIDIWKRIIFIKMIEEKLQNLIKENKYSELKNTIEELKNTITNYQVISSFDNIEKISKIKVSFINAFLKRKVYRGRDTETFVGILEEFNLFVKDKDDKELSLMLEEKEEKFNMYFKEYEYIFENYIVYDLYNNYMKALNDKDLNKRILTLVLKYSSIKMLLLSKWDKNDEVLNENDIIDVIYSFSRSVEHNKEFVNSLSDDLKEEAYDTLAYVSILVR